MCDKIYWLFLFCCIRCSVFMTNYCCFFLAYFSWMPLDLTKKDNEKKTKAPQKTHRRYHQIEFIWDSFFTIRRKQNEKHVRLKKKKRKNRENWWIENEIPSTRNSTRTSSSTFNIVIVRVASSKIWLPEFDGIFSACFQVDICLLVLIRSFILHSAPQLVVKQVILNKNVFNLLCAYMCMLE